MGTKLLARLSTGRWSRAVHLQAEVMAMKSLGTHRRDMVFSCKYHVTLHVFRHHVWFTRFESPSPAGLITQLRSVICMGSKARGYGLVSWHSLRGHQTAASCALFPPVTERSYVHHHLAGLEGPVHDIQSIRVTDAGHCPFLCRETAVTTQKVWHSQTHRQNDAHTLSTTSFSNRIGR